MTFRLQPQGRRGIALVITLIMLSVTLVMAVAFLAISSRERNSVATTTDAAHARLATDAALAHAEAQVVASMLANTNPYNFGLLVSTNFINSHGYLHTLGANPTNVSYFYTNGGFVNPADLLQNIANLEYLPRAPVFVATNKAGNPFGGYDFRYYLDLNRNGQFDESGPVPNTMFVNNTYVTNGTAVQAGDPQWIGVLEHPDAPHGPQNKFIARYAFLAVPVGNTLDANAIYNDAQPAPGHSMVGASDWFQRNEGVGTWELNLAAFLADLNTNEWDNAINPYIYNYQTIRPYFNEGAAFQDAFSLLAYRYATNTGNQAKGYQVLTNYLRNGIDNYSMGPLLTNNVLPVPVRAYYSEYPWAGANNTNHFFTPSDFFDWNKTEANLANTTPRSPGFTERLLQAGTNNHPPLGGPNQVPTYDRYTFYRLLAQLGTDTTPDYGKLNINYRNVDNQGNLIPGMESFFTNWTALQFFTNAADRLLRTYTSNWFQSDPSNFLATYYGSIGNYTYYTYVNNLGRWVTNDPAGTGLTNRPLFGMTNQVPAFGVANIPVYLNGNTFVYTPAIQRLLQLAANIYDATTTNFYPSVFRPAFGRTNGNIYINGYQIISNNINGIGDYRLSQPVSVSLLAVTNVAALTNVNVYGVPWIIGAKKGLPNFNELRVLNSVQVSRLLRINRTATNTYDPKNYTTNQMYVMTISNTVGMAFWNSYNSNYYGSGNIEIYMQELMQLGLTNASYSGLLTTNFNFYAKYGYWPGSGWTYATASTPAPLSGSFVFTNWSVPFLTSAAFQYSSGLFLPFATNAQTWAAMGTFNFAFPQFGYMTTNWSQAFILDGPAGAEHVVDYVQFAGPNNTRNLSAELADPDYKGPPHTTYMWSTNGSTGTQSLPTSGEVNQINVSKGSSTAPPGGVWATTASFGGNDSSIQAQQAFFKGFFTPSFEYNFKSYVNTELSVQAPYTPTRTMYDYTLWQANDPLVHYLASDLNYIATNGTGVQKTDILPPPFNIVGLNLNQVGNRYQPWGVSGQLAGTIGVDNNAVNLAYKDPLVRGSDFWHFPTNQLPSVGWLGRVHRGTPWQTVYLKSTDLLSETNLVLGNIGTNTWKVWSGNSSVFDAANTAPVRDRLMFDIFTTEPNENASLGKLSVNQTNLAAWSALFSGLVVYTNASGPGTHAIFPPAGTKGINSPLGAIWNSIQQTRANLPSQSFQHKGDLLAAPALTEQSPFLPWNNAYQQTNGISDAMYEWLPQQTLSLVTVGTPRYVVYCYGQALKPAPGGLVAGGTYAGMCTNYQIVSESATRAVLQVQMGNTNAPSVTLKNLNPLPPDQ